MILKKIPPLLLNRMSELLPLNDNNLSKEKLVKPITLAYFFIGIIELIAEFNKDITLIMFSKPLLMPLLIALYICLSKKMNTLFIVALLFVWGANIFFIFDSFTHLLVATSFFIIHRILIIITVFKVLKFPGYFPLLIGCIPFLFVFLIVVNSTYSVLGNSLYLFIVQGLLLIVFGGYSLGNYILKSNKSNTYLLLCALLFAAAQFIVVMKIVYVSFNIFQPIAMMLFIFGQYLQCHFMLLEEKKKWRLDIINSQKKVHS